MQLGQLAVSPRLSAVTTPWVVPGALIDIDFAAARYYYAGRHFESEEALLAAAGGVRADAVITIGPYDMPGAPERVTNGDFSSGLDGWSSFGGGIVSIDEDGHCRIEGNGGNVPGFVRPVALDKGHAYRLEVWVRDGYPGPGDHSVGVGTHPSLFGALSATIGGQVGGGRTVGEVRSTTFSAAAETMFVGGRDISNPALGTTSYDDFSIREVLPCAGFAPGGFTLLVSGTTPAEPGAGKVVFQADDGAVDWPYPTPVEYNRVRLVWGSDGHLRFVVTETDQNGAAEQANLDLGVIAPLSAFEMVASVAQGAFRAALLGGPVLEAVGGDLPGIAVLRIGRGATGNLWDGAVGRVCLLPGPMSEAAFHAFSADRGAIVAWGDSLTCGAGASAGHAYPDLAQALFDPPRSVVNLGIGGQDATQVVARQGGVPLLLSVAADTIPASGPVAVVARNLDVLVDAGEPAGTLEGWLGGVPGTLATDAEGDWTFDRMEAGEAMACPPATQFMPRLATAMRDRIAWLWLGRNGASEGHEVVADIAATVAFLGHRRYLVGAVLPSASDDAEALAGVSALNAALLVGHGSRFVDLVALLQMGHDGSAEDLADVAAGLVPRSLRSDAIHLNDAGYASVAGAMQAATLAMGW